MFSGNQLNHYISYAYFRRKIEQGELRSKENCTSDFVIPMFLLAILSANV